MIRIFITTILFIVLSTLQLNAQVFTEDFESTVSMTSSPLGAWSLNTRLQSQGLKSDSCAVSSGSSVYLTSSTINTVGKYAVYLDFDQICKIEMFDSAYIEVSNDDGSTWQHLTGAHYLGSAIYGSLGNRFSELSYPLDWGSINPTSPKQSWWKSESFDISAFASNSSSVKVRFVLKDGNMTGASGRAGWFIDNISVTAAISEIIPPSITLLNPIIEDTVYNNSPVTITAEITDASAIDSALCIINVSPDGITDTIAMSIVTTDTFSCQIPFYGYGRTTNYSIKAVDASAGHNVAISSNKSYITKYIASNEVIIGTGSQTSYNPFRTNFDDSKTQMLFTAAELSAAGASAGDINSIAFDIISASTFPMNGFNIKIKATSLTTLSSISAFETIGFTTVYSPASYTITGTGWQEITFTSPYSWDGSSNIIIDICFDNDSYGSASTVNSSYATGFTYAKLQDNAAGCSFTSGTTQSKRPNIKLSSTSLGNLTNDIGVKNILNPTTGVVVGNDFEIKVDLYNFGIDTIRTAQINWSYDGVAQSPFILASQDSIMPHGNKSPIILDTLTSTIGAHHIKAWTNLPNGNVDNNYLNDTASYSFVGCASSLSGVYTIGGSGASYATISEALLAMDQCGISAPVIFNINSGTYNEQLNINTITGISATNTVTFQSTSNDSSTVNITHDAVNISDNYVVKIDGISNITFKNLGFTALDASFANVFVLENDAQNISLENNIIKTDNSAAFDNDNMFLISGIVGNNITIKNNSLLGSTKAIVLDATSPQSLWKINNNNIYGNYTSAIVLDKAISVEVMGNNITSDTNVCFSHYKAIVLNDNTGTAKIKANSIINKETSTPTGIELNNCNFSTATSAIVANNMILLRASASTDLVSAISNNLSSNVNYYFNTINIAGIHANSASLSLIGSSTNGTQNIDIINNIFANNAGGYIYNVSSVDTLLWNCNNNNLWSNNATGDIAKLGSSIIEYTDWAIESGATNFTNINPYFVSNTDLHIVNNLLNGIAIPISGITKDIDGQIRNTSTPDIGADEFEPYPYDATLLEILSPYSNCALYNEVVTLKIKNIGSASISGNFTASYKLDNNATVTESVTATIAAGSVYNFSFSTTVNLDVYSTGVDSTFDLKAWVSLQNDPIYNNDSVSINILSGYAPLSPTATDVSINYGDSALLTATSPDNLIWFATNTSSTALAATQTYNTGVLYDTTTFWVGALADNTNFKITEIVQYKYGAGGTNPYPSYFPTSDFDGIEISNTGTGSGDLSGYSIHVSSTYSSTTTIDYTFPANTTVDGGSVAMALYGYSLTVGTSSNNIFTISTSSVSADHSTTYWLVDPAGNVVDAFSYQNGTFPANSGVTTADFAGSLSNPSTFDYVGAIRNISDNNLASDWDFVHATNNSVGSFGTYNAHIPTETSCNSTLVPLTVNVLNIPQNDIGVIEIIKPISVYELTQNQEIELVIKNFGANTQNILPFAYTLNNGALVYDTLYRSLISSDTAHFISNQTIDLSQYGTHNLSVFTDLSGDSNNSNDTTSIIIINDSLNYCISKPSMSSGGLISEIILEDINNNSGDATCVKYSDFTNISTVLAKGLIYQISGSFGSCGGNYLKGAKAYIDFNNDNDFDDAYEEIADFGSSSSAFANSFSFSVPNHATVGNHRLRIVLRETPGTNNANVSPCGYYSYGETEDYTVTIIEQIPFDVSITSLTNIADTTNEGATVSPKIYLKNYGTNTLSSFDIKYEVNNGTPIVYNYTSSLLPGDIDSVTLASFVSPAADVNLCVYSAHPQDLNAFNNIICTDYFAIESKDAELIQIAGVSKYCGMQYDTIKVQLTNMGVDTMNSTTQTTPITISYQSNSLSPITETLTSVLAPGDSIWYTFNTLAYVGSNNIMDSIYNISAWINYTGDNNSVNDSAHIVIESIHSPNDPIVVSPVVIPYATYASVSANSVANDTILWYPNASSTTILFGGVSHTNTWLSTVDTTYYAQTVSGTSGININVGQGTVLNNASSFPTPYGNHWKGNKEQYLILASELTAMGISPGAIEEIAFDVVVLNSCPTLDVFDIKMGHTNQVSLNNFAIGLSTVMSATSGYQPTSGWNNHTLNTPFNWDGISNIVVEVCTQNTGWSMSSNAAVNSSTTSFISARYKVSDSELVCSTTSTGTASMNRPNMKLSSNGISCTSARVPVTIDVLAPSNCDVGISNIIDPNSGVYKTDIEVITAKVHNYGAVDQTSIPVNYQIDGGAVVTETVSVPALSTIDYSFTTTADLSVTGHQYDINVFTSLACDTTTVNNEFDKTVDNLIPSYCISKATSNLYHDISNFTFGGINNTSVMPFDKLYTDYTNLSPAFLPPGSTNTLSITISSASTNANDGYVKVYLDYNKDGSYDPVTEKAFGLAYTGVSSTNPVTINGSIIIPANVVTGLSQMRVVSVRNGSALSVEPCGTYYTGETEDYSVIFSNIIANDAAVEFVIADNISTSNSIPLSARVKNYGSSIINSLDVSYTVNGGSPVTMTYNTPINSGDFTDISLGNATIIGGMNNVCVYTTLAGDANTFNDQKCKGVFKEAVVNLSYTDDFEGAVLWFNDTLVNEWEHGVPTMTNINTAHSPSNVWALDLDNIYDNAATQYLYTPEFNVPNNVDTAVLKFWHYYDSETGEDGGYIQYQKNNGPWLLLGYIGDPQSTNWYDNAFGGIHKWSGNSNGWIESKYAFDLNGPSFSNTNTLKLRYVFYSSFSSNNFDGWAIDDFSFVLPPVTNDIGATAIVSPATTAQTGEPITISIDVKNYGLANQSTFDAWYQIGTGPVTTQTFTPTGGLLAGSTQTFTFTTTAIAPADNFIICAGTDLSGDTYTTNDDFCGSPIITTAAAIDGGVTAIGKIQDWGGNNETSMHSPVIAKAEITNFGINTLTSFDVEYSVDNGSTWKTETWTGSLATGEVDTIVFAATYNSPIGNNYSLCIRTVVPNDAFEDNDMLCKTYLVSGINNSKSIIFEVSQSEPNPAVGNVRINYIVPTKGDINFELRNTLGQLIYSTEQASFTGKNTIEIDANKLANGIYYYSVVFDGQRITRKMIVNQ